MLIIPSLLSIGTSSASVTEDDCLRNRDDFIPSKRPKRNFMDDAVPILFKQTYFIAGSQKQEVMASKTDFLFYQVSDKKLTTMQYSVFINRSCQNQ